MLRERVPRVARVDALGRVAYEEAFLPPPARGALQLGDARFLRGAGVDGGFEDDCGAQLQHRADRAACGEQRLEVRQAITVDGRGDCDDDHIGGREGRGVCRDTKPRGRAQLGFGNLARRIEVALACRDALSVAIEPDGVEVPPQRGREREAHVAQTHDADGHLAEEFIRNSPLSLGRGADRLSSPALLPEGEGSNSLPSPLGEGPGVRVQVTASSPSSPTLLPEGEGSLSQGEGAFLPFPRGRREHFDIKAAPLTPFAR